MTSLTLAQALKCVKENAQPGKSETVHLSEALGRIPVAPLRARIPVPHFNRALMDGFAVRSKDLDFSGSAKERPLNIVGEIPAGRIDIPQLKKGQAVQIMTGGAIPKNADQVIPRENCTVSDSTLSMPARKEPKSWIQKKGSILRHHQVIAKSGIPFSIEQIAMLAKAGVVSANVYKPATVSLLSTGSELVQPGTTPLPGQVVSANSLQLAGLLHQSSCIVTDSAMAEDRQSDIIANLKRQLATCPDVLITTGGMGPGKFDLIPSVFKELGIEVLYRSLQVNPGKNTMLGVKNSTLIFALPGPPPAVRLLFHELVGPALCLIMGAFSPFPKSQKAIIEDTIHIRRPGFQSLLAGKTTNNNGQVSIRRTKRHETADAIILIPAHRRLVKAGEKVTFHPT